MTPHNFFRKQKEYTNEFISRVISVQCDRSTCKKHACNAAIPVACTVKSKKKMPGFQFPAYKLHVPRQIEILFSTLMTLFCEKWPYFITSFFPDWLFGTCGSISHSKDILWCVDDTQWYCNWEVKSKHFWYIHTGRSRGAWAPLVFRPNWGPKGRKKLFLRPSPHLRFWMTTPNLPPHLPRLTESLDLPLHTWSLL